MRQDYTNRLFLLRCFRKIPDTVFRMNTEPTVIKFSGKAFIFIQYQRKNCDSSIDEFGHQSFFLDNNNYA